MGFLAPVAGSLVSGIGSIVGGLFGGKKAGAAQTEDSARMTEGTGDLRNVFNYALPTGKNVSATGQGTTAQGLATARSGTSTMADPLSYYKNILSGNRTANLQAFAPESNAILNQQGAERRQQAATGTARGGGVASANEEAKTRAMQQLDTAIFGARPAAAAAVTDIGKGVTSAGLSTATLGNQQLAEALNFLGLGANSGNAIADIGLKRAGSSPGALSPTGQATSSGAAVAKGGMDLASTLIGQWANKNNRNVGGDQSTGGVGANRSSD